MASGETIARVPYFQCSFFFKNLLVFFFGCAICWNKIGKIRFLLFTPCRNPALMGGFVRVIWHILMFSSDIYANLVLVELLINFTWNQDLQNYLRNHLCRNTIRSLRHFMVPKIFDQGLFSVNIIGKCRKQNLSYRLTSFLLCNGGSFFINFSAHGRLKNQVLAQDISFNWRFKKGKISDRVSLAWSDFFWYAIYSY